MTTASKKFMLIDQKNQNSQAIQWISSNLPRDIQSPGFGSVSGELLTNIIQRIISGVDPQKVILFGSYANGHPTPDSDLDLLVIMETQARPAERVLAVSRLLRPRPFPMDILVRTPTEINLALTSGDTFIREILTNGKVLYEKHQ